jgi:cell pole-organizing protein PopZ
MAQSTAKIQEPSMEEILASIRRIISDDSVVAEAPRTPVTLREVKPEPQPAPEPEPAAAEPPTGPMTQEAVDALLSDSESVASGPDPGVLELTEAVETPTPAAMRAIEAADVVFRDPEEPATAKPEAPARQVAMPSRNSTDDGLMSEQATAAVSAAFDSLANTFFSQNARTIEDLVREMLRPMLRHWLDDNLPGLVERLVRAEIERVARGGR